MKATEYPKYLKSIFDFFVKEKLVKKPYPKVHLNNTKQEDEVLGPTAYYDNVSGEIVLFIKDRFCKDVLRSFSHELIHLSQRQRGILNDDDGKTTSLSDKRLEMLESEAYEKGNIGFRKWTEYYAKKQGKE